LSDEELKIILAQFKEALARFKEALDLAPPANESLQKLRKKFL